MQKSRSMLLLGLLAGALSLVAGPATARGRTAVHVRRDHWALGVVFPVRTTVRVPARALALVDFNVHPKSTTIWVDGSYRGTCDEFDGYPQKMALRPGRHRILLRFPDGREVVRTVELTPGYELNIDIP